MEGRSADILALRAKAQTLVEGNNDACVASGDDQSFLDVAVVDVVAVVLVVVFASRLLLVTAYSYKYLMVSNTYK